MQPLPARAPMDCHAHRHRVACDKSFRAFSSVSRSSSATLRRSRSDARYCSTNASYDFLPVRIAFTSSMDGGRPIKSRLRRRSSVTRSVCGDGASFSPSSLARTKRSIAFFAHCLFVTSGSAGRRGGMNAQCFFASDAGDRLSGHKAPRSIQSLMSAI